MLPNNPFKIAILTQSHLSRNPRVLKEAIALSNKGFDITVLSTKTDDSLSIEDNNLISNTNVKLYYYSDVSNSADKSRKFKFRIIRKLALIALGTFNYQSGHSLGYGFSKLNSYAKEMNADLYICHQEMASIAGVQLAKSGFNVAFDLEDWYSEDLLPESRKNRPLNLLKETEKFALNNGVYCTTTSKSMAIKMGEDYHSSPPEYIYNSFPLTLDNPINNIKNDRLDLRKPSFFWFSQTIGPGRGLETFLQAVTLIDTPIEIHLRGNCNAQYKNQLQLIIAKTKHDLFFHELVQNIELPFYIRQHDIGLALEANKPKSRDLTVTNKILQYLLEGLTVIASDTEGQKEIADIVPAQVFLYQNENIESLANIIQLAIKAQLNKSKISNFPEELSWDSQKDKIVLLVSQFLHPK